MSLVLSLFPGIGLLDYAFEEAGFCVVRGPDKIWGGDIENFHPPAGVFDGVIGGPPCQEFSALAPLVRHNGHTPKWGNMIPEYERVVDEALPAWFMMENVRGAPLPDVEGYDRWSELIKDSDVGGVQPRVRRISLGLKAGAWGYSNGPFEMLEYDRREPTTVSSIAQDSGIAYEEARRKRSITGDSRQGSTGSRLRGGGGVLPHVGGVLPVEDMLEAQGFPRDMLDHCPFKVQGKREAIGNGVPLPMGRAIAKLVKTVTL